ncbi:hypothetical protein NLJ89_g7529 [Agrocybe chaxingu]|uniref:Uncharacterized protein n=1 Tax=Agrocybe chaxingu TaxID=84603 RepID=A0A9W8JX06_9AGAR|nr:hypothetical protein NLJ89_g7529 [Agrocybe chaxingu]
MSAQASSSAPMATIEEDRRAARSLISLAYTAEIAGEWKEAFNLHTRAGNILLKTVAKGQKKSEERRKDKLLLRASTERRTVLRPAAEGNGPPPRLLPSQTTKEREFAHPEGKILLTMVERGIWGTLVGQTEIFDGLVFDENQVPYFTPMLPPATTLPDVEFHVYSERQVRRSYIRFYFHVKDSTKSQTIYSLHGVRGIRQQFAWSTLSRVAEYEGICASVEISPVQETNDFGYANGLISRLLTIKTCSGTTVIDRPDRLGKGWCPRRFTYGGRRFVWKDETKFTKEREAMYEVKKELPVEGSKTGKMTDETFERPLAWVLGKSSVRKVCTIGMVGGLDQAFQEYILASTLSKLLIVLFGHDNRK